MWEILILVLLLGTGKKCLMLTIIWDMIKSLTGGAFNTGGSLNIPLKQVLKNPPLFRWCSANFDCKSYTILILTRLNQRLCFKTHKPSATTKN
jgi:hypothetical protein